MIHPSEFYKNQKLLLEKESLSLNKTLQSLVIFRLAVFLATSFLIYLTFGKYPDVFIIAFLGLSLFSFLVLKYINIKKKKAIVDAKIKINLTEIKVLNRDFYDLEIGDEFVDTNHFYSNDIDLFGVGSFFQYINRTATKDGKQLLAKLLSENTTNLIEKKQEAIKELATKATWRQHFSAIATSINVASTTDAVIQWISSYKVMFPKFLKTIPRIFSIISIVLFVLVIVGKISFSLLLVWFFVGLFTTASFIKKIQQLYLKTNKVSVVFKQYNVLLNEIENENFKATLLVEKQTEIKSENKKAGTIFKEFSKILDAFDQRNNVLIAVLGNGLFLWDVKNACNIESWILNYSHTVEKWFRVVAFFDAQNSLANFKFNHPDFCFPAIHTSTETIKAVNLGHPLLDAQKRVDNDFTINDAQFFIITGANMAGKSTFLRTLSLSIVMANCGLPVCANSFTYSPIKLITSMRTSDSLTEDESYFYSELKRLKFIVDAISSEKYFIILDEILKGTNSKDKAIGSKKFVEKLSKSMSTGIIATHDVSLCALEDDLKGINNYYFDAEIIKNELHFDYTLKKGICKNMNASFLLQKMEII